jgi:tripartite-type tricarboxylate transporter receptor subunit TctC
MRLPTRCTLALFALAAVSAASVQAAEYPERNITVIVPFPAGGASDMTARLVTPKLGERVKQSVIVDNRAGANGSLGATAMKQAPADGYTLLVGSIGVFAINPALYKDLRYDPQKDFDLLSVVVRTPNVLVANPGFPANNVRELIEQLNKNPGKITFASSGTGSSDHLTPRCSGRRPATSGIHVPYRGGGPAINDLIAGHANVSFQNLGAIAEQVKAGRLKALAVTSDKRVPILPDVPTMARRV